MVIMRCADVFERNFGEARRECAGWEEGSLIKPVSHYELPAALFMDGEIGWVVFGVKQDIAFVGGSAASMKVDEYIRLNEGFLEIDVGHYVGGTAVLVPWKELADIFAVDA